MSSDWPFSSDQRDFQSAIARALGVMPEPDLTGSFPHDKWRTMAALGSLAVTSPEVGADALDVVAAGDALGAAGAPGPWWQTLLVVPSLRDDDAQSVMSGELVATAGSGEHMPWAAQAARHFEIGQYDRTGWRVTPVSLGDIRESWISLGQEPVVAADLVPAGEQLLVKPTIALTARLGLSAYLAGAGRRALMDVIEYATQRTQFRTRIGDFAAVSHPLADLDSRLRAAALLARRAAVTLDTIGVDSHEADVAVHVSLRASARSAREAVYQAHQTYGAIGFAVEGPLAWLGQRIAQLATEAQQMARQVSTIES